MGKVHFEIFVDADDEFRWRLRAANGIIVAVSGDGYKRRISALAGIKLVMGTTKKTLVDNED